MKFKLRKIPHDFSVCQVEDFSMVDWTAEFCFAGKTDAEYSLVCRTEDVPENVIRQEGCWKAFRVEGVLKFSLVGVLSGLSALLAENGIGIFAISTYNTDYILTKEEDFKRALEVLFAAGYEIV